MSHEQLAGQDPVDEPISERRQSSTRRKSESRVSLSTESLHAVIPQLEAPEELVDVGMEKEEDLTDVDAGTLMTDEYRDRAVGHVGLAVYLEWAKAAGGAWVPFLIVFVYGAAEAVRVTD